MSIEGKKIDSLLEYLKQLSVDTYEHSIRVGELCSSFGKFFGLDDEEIQKVRISGLLHDIGKIKIPLTLLHKKESLTEKEYEFIKRHVEYGIDIIKKAEINDEDILNSVLYHHERIDGLGYPNGAKEEEIPFLAKILVICDSYDAMNSVRSYRDRLSQEKIRNELLLNSGTQFDEKLVNSFLLYLDQVLSVDETKVK